MNRLISELVKVTHAVSPADIVTQRTGGYVSMEDYRQAQAVAVTGTVAAGSTVTVQLMQAKDAAGTDAKVLGSAVVETAGSGGQALAVTAEANASDLDEGFTHVGVRVSSNNGTAVTGSAVILRANGRFGTSRP